MSADTKVTPISETFYDAPGDGRPTKTLACCPWHEEGSPSLLTDHTKGTFHCLGCDIEGVLLGVKEGELTLQRTLDESLIEEACQSLQWALVGLLHHRNQEAYDGVQDELRSVIAIAERLPIEEEVAE